jgi:hypothetical protein
MAKYFVLQVDEMGKATIERLLKDQMEREINEAQDTIRYVQVIPDQEIKKWPPGTAIIIKGDIVIPRDVKTVVTRTID